MDLQTRISKKIIEKFSTDICIENYGTIKKEYVHKLNEKYALLTEIRQVPEEYIISSDLDVQNSFFTYALPKLDCNFCFDHELDHVPFMMIIEFFRQFGVSVSHVYHKVPLKGYKNIMSELNFNSFKFVELDIPVAITCEEKIVKEKPEMQKRVVLFELYQNNELCASMSSNITVIRDNVYDRTRNRARLSSVRNTGLPLKPVTNNQLLKYQLV